MRKLLAAFLVSLLFVLPASAESPKGQVILTVSGNIKKPNRGPSDGFMDMFFTRYGVKFEQATEFDLVGLEKLGTRKVTVSSPAWPRSFTFEGPMLSDVLKAAGAEGSTLLVRALDGYAVPIPVSDIEKYPIILALKMDEKYLGIGGYAPSWVIYPRDDYPDLANENNNKFVWSVYHIEVQ